MRKTNVTFSPGEPLPASKHNDIVASSYESGSALGLAHDANHGHVELRMEYAQLSAQWDGSAWSEVFSGRASIESVEDRTALIVRIHDDGEIFDPDHLGLIIQDSAGYTIPYSLVLRDGDLHVAIHPRPQSAEFTMIAFGRRSFGRSDVRGISWDDGGPAYAMTGEYIGVEHVNEAMAWTRRYSEAALREHGEDGHHYRSYHCIGSVVVLMPLWGLNGNLKANPRIIAGQLYEHEHHTYEPAPGHLFEVSAVNFGEMRISTALSLPGRYRVMVGSAPQPVRWQDSGGSTGIESRIFRTSSFGPGEFNVSAHAIGTAGGLTSVSGYDRRAIALRIYAEERSSGPALLTPPLYHHLVDGGYGEVIPAEMYQAVADFQRSTSDHLEADHDIAWNNRPAHESMRWFRAVAHFDIVEDQDDEHKPGMRMRFAEGFVSPPVVSAESRVVRGLSRLPSWWMDWDAGRPAHGWFVGVRLRNGAQAYLHPRDGDMDEGGKGSLNLGQLDSVFGPEQEVSYEPGEGLRNIRAITLAVM